MNKTVLITGASNGIGYELAKLMAKDKYNLVLTARSSDKLYVLKGELEKEYSVKVKVIVADLSKEGVADIIYNEVKKENIRIDILVNNAGFGDYALFYESDWTRISDMIHLNIIALTNLTRLFINDMMLQKNGRIMNVASLAAFLPGPLQAVYFATKAYVLSFSEAIANELKGTGVTVTALCPGATNTGFAKGALMENSKLFKNKNLPNAKEVATYAYKSMMKGKTVAVHGFMNKVLALLINITPRCVVTNIARNMQKE